MMDQNDRQPRIVVHLDARFCEHLGLEAAMRDLSEIPWIESQDEWEVSHHFWEDSLEVAVLRVTVDLGCEAAGEDWDRYVPLGIEAVAEALARHNMELVEVDYATGYDGVQIDCTARDLVEDPVYVDWISGGPIAQ